MILPDVLINEHHSDLKTENLAKMMEIFEHSGVSQIMLEEVPHQEVSHYGIGDLNGEPHAPGDSIPMAGIVEKPSVDEAPSNLAVVGRYILSKQIWEQLDFTPPGAGNEIQLTDAIASLMKIEQVNAFSMTGKSNDCGSKLGYMKANMEYGLKHPSLG